jgi:oligopeptide transport system ATP-binding protein
MTAGQRDTLLSIRDLRVVFDTGQGPARAVDGMDLEVMRGQRVAVVGESGSGKSVTAMAVLGLLPVPPARVSGYIGWLGEDLLAVAPRRLRRVRGGEIGMVFQDPFSSLNPSQQIGRQVAEILQTHLQLDAREARRRAVDLLERVGLPEPPLRARNYPHELSGGMLQRAMIAMAIACRPLLLIADEPTTALDVTVQSQVFELLLEVQAEIDSGMVLITHDLGVVAGFADEVVVMYAGRAVERAAVQDLFAAPSHPYTAGLLGSLHDMDHPDRPLRVVPGQPPSPLALPPGCPFHPRCPRAELQDPCASLAPALRSVPGGVGHQAACHFVDGGVAVSMERPERPA